MGYEVLNWDSELFGKKVARITSPALDALQLGKVLQTLADQNVKLAYWLAAAQLTQADAKRLGAFLADLRTTFVVNLDCLPPEALVPDKGIEAYTPSMPTGDLRSLAIQSGEQSRFAVDPRVPRAVFEALYKAWMDNSLSGKLAREVLTIREGEHVAGMITLGEKNHRGDIDLIAVDAAHRGKGYGERLVRAAQQRFVHHGHRLGQVVTQGRNAAACSLYQKCGFHIEKTEHYYHFWL